MNIDKKTKQPHEVLDFDIDGSRRIGDDDSIADVSVTITGPDGVLFQPVPATWSETVAKIWLAGGMDGEVYKVTILVITMGARKIEREFLMYVKER